MKRDQLVEKLTGELIDGLGGAGLPADKLAALLMALVKLRSLALGNPP